MEIAALAVWTEGYSWSKESTCKVHRSYMFPRKVRLAMSHAIWSASHFIWYLPQIMSQKDNRKRCPFCLGLRKLLNPWSFLHVELLQGYQPSLKPVSFPKLRCVLHQQGLNQIQSLSRLSVCPAVLSLWTHDPTRLVVDFRQVSRIDLKPKRHLVKIQFRCWITRVVSGFGCSN